MAADYDVQHYNARWWVRHRGRLLGAYSNTELRSYVFPLYTPGGALVLQESPADHPHHQGIFVGLNIDGHDLWNAGSFGVPRHRQQSRPTPAQLVPDVADGGVTFSHETQWLTEDRRELLLEKRRVELMAIPEGSLVRWRSEFSHPTKLAQLHRTKEAGIGLRVPPHWETIWGGQIRNDSGDIGELECFDKVSAWLNVEGPAGGESSAGIIFMPPEPCPWFTRDYGLHSFNPLRQQGVSVKPGQSLVWEMSALAYDGQRSLEGIYEMAEAMRSHMGTPPAGARTE